VVVADFSQIELTTRAQILVEVFQSRMTLEFFEYFLYSLVAFEIQLNFI
jgi:hypothetical protein